VDTPTSPGKTVAGEVEVIKQMIDRLRMASAGGWGDHPVVPQPLISVPEERPLSSDLTVIAWPEDEYNQWVSAWDYLAGTVLQRLGTLRQFPLGDRSIAMANLDRAQQDVAFVATAARGVLASLPDIDDGLDGALGLLVDVKRKLKPAAAKKPLISGAALISFLLAAIAGGAILYYYRRKERSSLPAPATPDALPEAPVGWY
jgi:hypothetical protein